MRTSEALIETRVTESGREMAAAVLPSDRLVMVDRGTTVMYESKHRCPAEPLTRKPANCRAGVLYRKEDESGVSGTGVVADFVHFPNGIVVQEWRNETNPNLEAPEGVDSSGVDIRPTMSMAVQIHGHQGRTEYIYNNGEVAQP